MPTLTFLMAGVLSGLPILTTCTNDRSPFVASVLRFALMQLPLCAEPNHRFEAGSLHELGNRFALASVSGDLVD